VSPAEYAGGKIGASLRAYIAVNRQLHCYRCPSIFHCNKIAIYIT